MFVTFVSLLVVAVTILFWMFLQEQTKNESLRGLVRDLQREINTPKYFGLKMLERVGEMLGGLTSDVVRKAYATAFVCGRQNVVETDLADAMSQKNTQIEEVEGHIDTLNDDLATARITLDELNTRMTDLITIGKLVPKE